MRKAIILYKDEAAGELIQLDDGTFIFRYFDAWMDNDKKPPIGLALSKNKQEYKSTNLFPFFYNLLPEGSNKKTVARNLNIEENDDFSILIATGKYDTNGAITIMRN